MLTLENTVNSYSGKPGCMCGCNGTYNEGAQARKMAMTALLKHPAVGLQSWEPDADDAGCLFVETDTRVRVLYLNEAGVAAARALGVTEVE